MASELEKMRSGALYDPADSALSAARQRARRLCHALNLLDPADTEGRAALLDELFGRRFGAAIQPPFHCDYGHHIERGENVYFNAGCVVLDVAPVRIGRNVLFGPGVQVYAASHPLQAAARRCGLELGAPVTVGDDVWVGGAAVLCPGVSVGARSVIGAGSVVTRDVPADVLAAGNPCRVIRALA